MVDRDQNGNEKPDLMTKIQNLAKKVPGLDGYLKREDIRERDKILREHSAKKIVFLCFLPQATLQRLMPLALHR